jgi:hypothetical protein
MANDFVTEASLREPYTGAGVKPLAPSALSINDLKKYRVSKRESQENSTSTASSTMVIFWGNQAEGDRPHHRLLPSVDVEFLPDITHVEIHRRLGTAGNLRNFPR